MPDVGRARYRRILRFAMVCIAQAWWFELFLPRIGLARFSARGRTARLTAMAKRFHALAVRLGGLMIKVGQFLSSRLDVLPPEITDELSGLQDEVPPVAFPAIRELAEAQLGVPLAVAYAWFDETPLAAASLGQAHRAGLSAQDAAIAGFEGVVVKVQRPGIEAIVDVDLRALRRVAGWLSRVRIVSDHVDMPELVEEFAHTSLEEIDYLHEAASAERFAADFAADPRVAVPDVVWERTTRRVLTLSDVTAIKINDVEGLRAAGIDPHAVASVFAAVMFDQLFVNGFFHADPHPGNIFVTPVSPPRPEPVPEPVEGPSPPPVLEPAPPVPEPVERSVPEPVERSVPEPAKGWKLTFIDFGMMGEVPATLRSGLRRLLIAVASRDGKGLVDSIRDVGVLLPTADATELERAMTQLFARFGGMGFAELAEVDPREFRDFAEEFGDVVRSLPFQLPENFLLIIRAMSLTSGMCSSLNPAFNIWDAVEPYAGRLLREERGNVVQAFARDAVSVAGIAARLPRRLDALVTRIEDGDVSVQSPRLERRVARLERVARRVVSAVIFAGLLVGGLVLRPDDAVWGTVLIVLSVPALLHALLAGWFDRRG